MKTDHNLLKNYIRALVESRLRETDITDGSRVPFGSKKHVADLETRITDLERWRDRQRRGTEARANYARLIGRLRSELRAAGRYAERKATETLDRAENKPEDDLLIDDDV
jgi:RNA polymerase-interacting CarD/CdnL/TRCF family regulator